MPNREDPARMTPDQRRREIAEILAVAFLRWRRQRRPSRAAESPDTADR